VNVCGETLLKYVLLEVSATPPSALFWASYSATINSAPSTIFDDKSPQSATVVVLAKYIFATANGKLIKSQNFR